MKTQPAPPQLRRILFAQNAKVIDEHRTLTGESQLAERLNAAVEFASSPADIAPGAEFDAVIAPTVDWLPELLARTTGVRWVHFLSSGVEKIWEMDVDWSAYALSSSKGVHAVPISEYVLGAMLHFAKRFDQFTAQSRNALWRRERMGELTDAEVLIVGAGSIGRAVAERSRFLGMRPRLVARTARTDPDLGEVLGFPRPAGSRRLRGLPRGRRPPHPRNDRPYRRRHPAGTEARRCAHRRVPRRRHAQRSRRARPERWEPPRGRA